ncbi:MAG: tandem-95 repeat protein, partial [Pseudomonadota bacterium]
MVRFDVPLCVDGDFMLDDDLDDVLLTTDDPNVTVSGDRTVFGSSLTDIITGSSEDDVLLTGGGVDVVFGSDGNDIIDTGAGNDFAFGGIGNSTIIGGLGNDNLFGDQGSNLLLGEEGNDSLVGGSDADTIFGGIGQDTIVGGDGTNTLIGGAGNDSILGGAGTDHIYIDLAEEGFVGETIDGAGGTDTIFLLFDNFAAFNEFDGQFQISGSNEAALAAYGFALSNIENIEIVPIGLAPELNDLDFFATEDDGFVTLELAEAIVNAVGNTFSVQNLTLQTGALSFFLDGTDLVFDSDQFNFLSEGELEQIEFQYEIADEFGLIGSAQASLEIAGENDDVTIDTDASSLDVVTNISAGFGFPTLGQEDFEGFFIGTRPPLIGTGLTITGTGFSDQIVDPTNFGVPSITGLVDGNAYGFVDVNTITFDQTVSFVSFALADVSLPGLEVTALDGQGNVLDEISLNATALADLGDTPALISLNDTGGGIASVEIDPVSTDFVIIDNLIFGDTLPVSVPRAGLITFDEFEAGTGDPISDGFVTISTQADNFTVRNQQFTQFPDVFEGRWLGFGPTLLTLDFADPVSLVSFGLFDPNFLGTTVQAFDGSGNLLQTLTVGQEIPAGSPGGTFSTTVVLAESSDLIASVVIDSTGSADPIGIDTVFYQTGTGFTNTIAVGPTVTFNDPDLNDIHTVDIIDFGFLSAQTLIAVNPDDVLDVVVVSPTSSAPGQVFIDVVTDASFFVGFQEGDVLDLQGTVVITDSAGSQSSEDFTIQIISDDGLNAPPVLDASTLSAEITVDQVDLSLPTGVIDFEAQTIGTGGPITDGFATVDTLDQAGTVQAAGAEFPRALASNGNVFGERESTIRISFDDPVDSVGFGLEVSPGGDAEIRILGTGDVVLETLNFSDLDTRFSANGDDSGRAYVSRSTAEIIAVEIVPASGSTIAVDEIRYGFGDLLTLFGLAQFQDPDGVAGQDAFLTEQGSFVGAGQQIAFNPVDFDVSEFQLIDPSISDIASRTVQFQIENNLFGFLGEGQTVQALLPTAYRDDAGQEAQADFTFTFTGVNDAPLAVADAAATDEDTAITINITGNDIDLENDQLTIVSINGETQLGSAIFLNSGAEVRLNGIGSIDYDPTGSLTIGALNTGESLTESFDIIVQDPGGLTSTATVEIQVAGVTDITSTAVTLANQFNPSQTGSLHGLTTSPDGAEIAAIAQGSSTIEFYTPQGVFLRSIPMPGDNGNDGDLDYFLEPAVLGATQIPEGALLVMSGDSGTADLFAVDPVTGQVLASLATDFGNSFTVGAAYNPVTNTYFLLTCNCDSDGNVIAEIDPVTGQTLSRIDLDPLGFQTFFGDIDVDPVTGDLFVVSDQAPGRVFRLGTDGTGLENYQLPGTVTNLSGISVVAGDPAEFVVASTGGLISRVIEGAVPINFNPVAGLDQATTSLNTPVTLDVALNDADPNADNLTFSLFQGDGLGSPDQILDFNFTGTGTPPDPSLLLDQNFSTFVALPTGSSVTVAFLDEIIIDRDGDEFRVTESFNGDSTARVEVSFDGVNFVDFGVISGDTGFDLASFGFFDERLYAVRVTGLDQGGSVPGFDLLGITASPGFTTTQGLVTPTGGSNFEYNPNGAFAGLGTGETATDGFAYRVDDGQGGVDYATVTVTITGEAAALNAVNDGGLFPGFAIADGTENDYNGFAVSRLGDINGDGFDDVVVSAPYAGANSSSTNYGQAYVVFGGPDVSFTAPSELDGSNGFRLFSSSALRTGMEVADAGDLNGDGLDDLFVGIAASYSDPNYAGLGVVVFGRDTGFAPDLDLGDLNAAGNLFITAGQNPGTNLGFQASSAGDFNGDGIDDLVINGFTPGYYNTFDGPFIIFGTTTPGQFIDVTQLDGTNGIKLSLPGIFSAYGADVAGVGDINGDGLGDVAFSREFAAPNNYSDPFEVVQVVMGIDLPLPSTLPANDVRGLTFNGPADIGLGRSISSGGDLNGDGIDDFVIGAYDASIGVDTNGTPIRGGAAFVVFGNPSIAAPGGIISLSANDLDGVNGFVVGTTEGEFDLGYSVEIVGDVNGDGIDDLLIGAPQGGSYDQLGYSLRYGEAIVIFGRDTATAGDFSAVIDTYSMTSTTGLRFDGTDPGSLTGRSVSGGMDLNGDGISDFVIGAPGFYGTSSYDYSYAESIVLFGDTNLVDLDTNGDGIVSGSEIDASLVAATTLTTAENAALPIAESFLLANDVLAVDIVSVDATSFLGATIGFDGTQIVYDAQSALGLTFGEFEFDQFTYTAEDAQGNTDTATVTVLVTGPAPTTLLAGPDTFTVLEDVELDLLQSELTGNDFDPLGGFLAVTGAGNPTLAGGVVTVGTGSVSYNQNGAFDTLRAGQTGFDSFTYQVTNGQDTAIGTVFLTITGVNDAPTAGTVNETVTEDGLLSIQIADLLAQAIDVDGDQVLFGGFNATSAQGVSLSGNETTIFYNAAGSFDDLDPGDSVLDTITYTVRDADNATSQGVINITVSGLNDPVTAIVDTGFSTGENAPLAISEQALLSNDIDVDESSVLSISSLSSFSAQGAQITFSQGNVNYIPGTIFETLSAGQNASDSFSYTVTDGNGSSSSATVFVQVLGENDAPVDGRSSTSFDAFDGGDPSPQFFNLLAGFSDPEGTNLSTQSVQVTSSNANRTVTFTVQFGLLEIDPLQFSDIPTGQSETLSITYQVADFPGLTTSATAQVTVNGTASGNSAVVGNDDAPQQGTGITIQGLSASDQSGSTVSFVGDVNGDGLDDFVIGAPNRQLAGIGEVGSAFLIFGRDAGIEDTLTLPTSSNLFGLPINGAALNGAFGSAITELGDVNGDLIDDFLVAAPTESSQGLESDGVGYVIFGTDSGFASPLQIANFTGATGFAINGAESFDTLGTGVGGGGDFNGDGVNDILIGAPARDAAGLTYNGQVFVIFGEPLGFDSTFPVDFVSGFNGVSFSGPENSNFGASVAFVGDFNGDTIDDIAVGAPNENATGEVYVIFGTGSSPSVDVNVSTLDGSNGIRILGAGAGSQSGVQVAGSGDFNGDTITDLLIATRADGGDTGAYVVFGSNSISSATLSLAGDLDGTNGFQIQSLESYDYAGSSVANAGDVNGDGIEDILIGAYGGSPNGLSNAGRAFLIFGSDAGFNASFSLTDLDGTNGFVFNGVDESNYTGQSVAGAGDVNGDGFDDILISAPNASQGTVNSVGETYLVFGGLDNLNTADGDADGVIELSDLVGRTGIDLTTDADQGLDITAASLLANDVDPDVGDTLTITSFDSSSSRGVSISFDPFTQTFNYNPTAALGNLAVGETVTDTFGYTVSDGLTTDTATVSIDVTGVPSLDTFATPVFVNSVPDVTLMMTVLPFVPLPYELDTIDVPVPDAPLAEPIQVAAPEIAFSSNGSLQRADLSLSIAAPELSQPAETFSTSFRVLFHDYNYSSTFTGDGMRETFSGVSFQSFASNPMIIEVLDDFMVRSQMTAGNDVVQGTVRGDLFVADLAGTDVLRGLFGDDLYMIVDGAGSVVIDDGAAGGNDTVQFNGLAMADALFTRGPGFSDDLIISDGRGLEVTIRNTLSDNVLGGIERIEFTNAVLSIDEVRKTLLEAAATIGDDQILGFASDDRINGGLGDDILSGGFGDDTFVFEIGSGTDVIIEAADVIGDTDTLRLVGRNFDEASFMFFDPAFDAVEIGFENGDRVVIAGALGDTATVERIEFDDR